MGRWAEVLRRRKRRERVVEEGTLSTFQDPRIVELMPCRASQIKTLTLSLVRTTTVFRPRPWLDAGNGHDPDAPGELDLDPDACQTQTTRKKVAESTLEMGKKGNKGVTAKGSWMGVDGGETADFSHFLLVPVRTF